MILKYYSIKIYAISLLAQPFYLMIFKMIFDVLFMIMVHFLVMYIMIKFIIKTNSIIINMNRGNKLFHRHITIIDSTRKFIMLHNHFSTIIYKINFLYSRLLFFWLLLCMPPNLINIQLLFFENTDLAIKFLFAWLAFYTSLFMILLLYLMAYLSKESHRTTIHLSRLQWRINGQPFGLRHKIKLMSYFERLSSNKKIGITIGPTVTLTMNLFSQVLFRYENIFINNYLSIFLILQMIIRNARYFLLIHRLADKLK